MRILSAFLFFVLYSVLSFAQAPAFNYGKIDLSNWKITLPYGVPDPIEVEPAELVNFSTDNRINKYLYLDPIDNGLVFYAYPSTTTKNTKYSRCELREQLEPGNDANNWTFKEGGRIEAILKIDAISKNDKNKWDKVVIMQIHGRLPEEKRIKIGKNDNDAPPIIKVSWYDGKVRLVSKVLKKGKGGKDIYYKDSWKDAEAFQFPVDVNFEKFKVEIIAEDNKLTVVLNDLYEKVYDSKDIKKWGCFENYFKAGNYLTTQKPSAFAKVKFFKLKVTH